MYRAWDDDYRGYVRGRGPRLRPRRSAGARLVRLVAGLALGVVLIGLTNWISDVETMAHAPSAGLVVAQTVANLSSLWHHAATALSALLSR